MLKTRIIKLALLVVLLFASKTQYAQGSVNNPYSRFGLGEMMYSQIHPYNGAMGGLSYTVKKNNMVNPFNPASYTGIDTCSFVFDIGFSGEFATLKDGVNTVKSNKGNISHLLVGFPLFKWWKASIGLLPLSDVNYSSAEYVIDPIIGKKRLEYKGEGALSKVYLGNAFQIGSNFSVGFNVNFIFGDMSYYSLVTFPDSSSYLGSRKLQTVDISSFSGDFGLQYFLPIQDKYKLGFGLTYSIPSKFNANVNEFTQTFFGAGASVSISDTASYIARKETIELHQSVGFGLSFENTKNWYVGADMTYTNWSNLSFLSRNNMLANNIRFSLGGNYTPNPIGRNYFQRISYRAGFHYEDNKYKLAGNSVNDMGVHLGFGIPFRKFGSGLNLHLQYGKLGTTENGLVQKDYFKIGISLSTSDIWFVKRKYD